MDQKFESDIENMIDATLDGLTAESSDIDDRINGKEFDMKLYRLENLMERRPFLLSNTLLRQNPHNVYEWVNRIKLCEVISLK